MLLSITFLVFISIGIICLLFLPGVFDYSNRVNQARSKDIVDKIERLTVPGQVTIAQMVIFLTLGPLIMGAAGFLFFPHGLNFIGLVLGIVIGFMGPSIYLKTLEQKRSSTFSGQLIDVLMMLSSSLKGGLSLIQALEVVVEEVPAPASQEFGLLLAENKMGVSLEESLKHLYDRIPSSALHQMMTAILVARETGGNLPVIFSRITTTVRENRKIQQNIDTLTVQGKIQGFVMSLLPVAFGIFIFITNKRYYDVMFNTDMGKSLLTYAFFSEIVGVFLIWKISSYKEF